MVQPVRCAGTLTLSLRGGGPRNSKSNLVRERLEQVARASLGGGAAPGGVADGARERQRHGAQSHGKRSNASCAARLSANVTSTASLSVLNRDPAERERMAERGVTTVVVGATVHATMISTPTRQLIDTRRSISA
jgi:hypothetical protein